MYTWKSLSFGDPLSPTMEQMIMFHDHTMMVIMIITMMVMYTMFYMMINKMTNIFMTQAQMIELFWTILPALFLILVALPSIRILYLIEEISQPMMTIKTIGHQWFWSYEYSDLKKIEFESYMKPTSLKTIRMMETDNRLILPFKTKMRLITTSEDVIHSWTIQSLGIKVDSMPGRINQSSIYMSRPGMYFGQCSEICGANHSFMPIMIESVNLKSFIKWIKNF
uniref:Cytochrome c oxidase subunit 2 n=1 Tax=Iassus lateralis TaxID=3054420 RepID=A0AA49X8Z7_9HEMI|nr:cytochrome c oxidase subunit II [Iassus lateralis]WIW75745.1 cytochrome c oxidase subunit II [Iassus lateralis]WKW94145.1 cytochrome c oxidase subunit II [Iassus lateralis]WLN32150.1 cytochrome c oxidase subunit II [Iassus lateralis]